jgi:hypothetical protein
MYFGIKNDKGASVPTSRVKCVNVVRQAGNVDFNCRITADTNRGT